MPASGSPYGRLYLSDKSGSLENRMFPDCPFLISCVLHSHRWVNYLLISKKRQLPCQEWFMTGRKGLN